MATAPESEYCSYISVKVDVDLVQSIKIAAAMAGKPIQEYASDALNEAAAKTRGTKPVKRKPPKPRQPPRRE